MNVNPSFWQNKKVLLTGHTGFKGAWASLWLAKLGAKVTGVSLAPPPGPSLFELADCSSDMVHVEQDIRNKQDMTDLVNKAAPDIIIHMAAQALVRSSYVDPVTTWETNVQGTLNLLEAAKTLKTPPVTLIVTSDKVYKNNESGYAFTEEDSLGGHDPYSASKAACEILTESWRMCFADGLQMPVASARAGNVVGGGDFSENRIIPDIWRAIESGNELEIRNPEATRPWQHVLDCLNGYFLYVELIAKDASAPRSLNFGPGVESISTVRTITEQMLSRFDTIDGWSIPDDTGPREMAKLSLNNSLAKTSLNWDSKLKGETLIEWTAEWYKMLHDGQNMRDFTISQIERFEAA